MSWDLELAMEVAEGWHLNVIPLQIPHATAIVGVVLHQAELAPASSASFSPAPPVHAHRQAAVHVNHC